MRKPMTVNDLLRILQQARQLGHGEAPVLFDTEARHYDFHITGVTSAHLEDAEAATGIPPCVILYDYNTPHDIESESR